MWNNWNITFSRGVYGVLVHVLGIFSSTKPVRVNQKNHSRRLKIQ